MIELGVNIDHVATLRQQRHTTYPDPVLAALRAEDAGADLITLHLREDRRHIQDKDVYAMRPQLRTRMNLECAVTAEMLEIACAVKPNDVCLVPEYCAFVQYSCQPLPSPSSTTHATPNARCSTKR